jgi:hypothetical protein
MNRRFDILAAVNINIAVCWDVTPYSLVPICLTAGRHISTTIWNVNEIYIYCDSSNLCRNIFLQYRVPVQYWLKWAKKFLVVAGTQMFVIIVIHVVCRRYSPFMPVLIFPVLLYLTSGIFALCLQAKLHVQYSGRIWLPPCLSPSQIHIWHNKVI